MVRLITNFDTSLYEKSDKMWQIKRDCLNFIGKVFYICDFVSASLSLL